MMRRIVTTTQISEHTQYGSAHKCIHSTMTAAITVYKQVITDNDDNDEKNVHFVIEIEHILSIFLFKF